MPDVQQTVLGSSLEALVDQQRKIVATCQGDALGRVWGDRAEAVKALAVAVDKLMTLMVIQNQATSLGLETS